MDHLCVWVGLNDFDQAHGHVFLFPHNKSASLYVRHKMFVLRFFTLAELKMCTLSWAHHLLSIFFQKIQLKDLNIY